jgi:hypothetical protein
MWSLVNQHSEGKLGTNIPGVLEPVVPLVDPVKSVYCETLRAAFVQGMNNVARVRDKTVREHIRAFMWTRKTDKHKVRKFMSICIFSESNTETSQSLVWGNYDINLTVS